MEFRRLTLWKGEPCPHLQGSPCGSDTRELSSIDDEVESGLRPFLELPLLAYQRSTSLPLIIVLVLDFLRTVNLFVAGTEMVDAAAVN